jgi:hypothetical protein
MRLLKTNADDGLELQDFTGQDIPPYAVLSHRWEDGEVTYQDIKEEETVKRVLSLINPEVHLEHMQSRRVDRKKGYSKVEGCCRQAKKDGFEYVWMDTCCIDKRSTAELSEAINSMFNWYCHAQVCFVYLSDVGGNDNIEANDSAFRKSVWFTRGWTLQELLAPADVKFFASDWKLLGSKSGLYNLISSIADIDATALIRTAEERSADPTKAISDVQKVLGEFSIARRMSWASKRKTTRVEDIAYCLLGIFNVNMPLIYGEGSKAFGRLQDAIMGMSEDQSIFAWKNPKAGKTVFASSPADFSGCSDIDGHVRVAEAPKPTSYFWTNRGLCIQLQLTQECGKYWVGLLTCKQTPPLSSQVDSFPARKALVGIYLEKWDNQEDLYNKVVYQDENIRIIEENTPQWNEIMKGDRKTIYIMGDGDQDIWTT